MEPSRDSAARRHAWRARWAAALAVASLAACTTRHDTRLLITLDAKMGETIDGIVQFQVRVSADGESNQILVPADQIAPAISIPPARTFVLLIPPSHGGKVSVAVTAVDASGRTVGSGRNDRISLAEKGTVAATIVLDSGVVDGGVPDTGAADGGATDGATALDAGADATGDGTGDTSADRGPGEPAGDARDAAAERAPDVAADRAPDAPADLPPDSAGQEPMPPDVPADLPPPPPDLSPDTGPDPGAVVSARRFAGPTDLDYALWAALDQTGAVAIAANTDGPVDFGGGQLNPAPSRRTFAVARFAADGTHLWSKVFSDLQRATAGGVAVDDQNNVIVAGCFTVSVDFGGGALTGPAMFAAKFSPTGTFIWSKTYRSLALADCASGVAVDTTDNVFITGHRDSDPFVAKLAEADGSEIWSRQITGGGATSAGLGVATDTSGNAVVVGSYQFTLDFGATLSLVSGGADDAFVAKFDAAAGTTLWRRGMGAAGQDLGHGVAIDNAGDVFATGTILGQADLGGGNIGKAGGRSAFFVKLAGADGAHAWSSALAATGAPAGNNVGRAATTDGASVFFAGTFADRADVAGTVLDNNATVDSFAIKMTSGGAVVWARTLGDVTGVTSGQLHALSISADGTGRTVLGGWVTGSVNLAGATSNGGRDLVLVRLGP